MKDLDVTGILKVGITGLGFLLALLAYRLISRAQDLKLKRPHSTRIYIFMAFSLLLCGLGLIPQIVGGEQTRRGQSSIAEAGSALQFEQTQKITLFVSSVAQTKPNCDTNNQQSSWSLQQLNELKTVLAKFNPGITPVEKVSWFESSDEDKSVKDADIIILGGPVRNCAFTKFRKELLDQLRLKKLPLDFAEFIYTALNRSESPKSENAIVVGWDDEEKKLLEEEAAKDSTNGEIRYFPATGKHSENDSKPQYNADFSFFIIGPNPFNSQHRLILIAGNHFHSTEGGLQYVLGLSQETVAEVRKCAVNVGYAGTDHGYISGLVRVFPPEDSRDQRYKTKLLHSFQF